MGGQVDLVNLACMVELVFLVCVVKPDYANKREKPERQQTP